MCSHFKCCGPGEGYQNPTVSISIHVQRFSFPNFFKKQKQTKEKNRHMIKKTRASYYYILNMYGSIIQQGYINTTKDKTKKRSNRLAGSLFILMMMTWRLFFFLPASCTIKTSTPLNILSSFLLSRVEKKKAVVV